MSGDVQLLAGDRLQAVESRQLSGARRRLLRRLYQCLRIGQRLRRRHPGTQMLLKRMRDFLSEARLHQLPSLPFQTPAD